MQFSDLVPKIHRRFKGKGAQKAPVPGNPKYEIYMSVVNDLLRSWADDAKYDWDSLFDEKVDIISSSVLLPADFIRTSDEVYLTTSTGVEIELNKIKARQRRSFVESFYITGSNPPEMKFTSDIMTRYAGESVSFGYFAYPPVITTADSEVVCDSFEWLATAAAAELARNDPAKDDQFPNLSNLAGVEYQKMIVKAAKITPGPSNRVMSKYPNMVRSFR